MSLMPSFDGEKAETKTALSAPIGAASPLWWAFAGVASAGVAYWWMTRWTRPMNLEAMIGPSILEPVLPEPAPGMELTPKEEALEEAIEEAAATYELAPEAVTEVLDAPVVEAEPFVEAAPEPVAEVLLEPELVEAPEPVVDTPLKVMEAELEHLADDLTLLIGVGPKLAVALAERGVTRFAQIAAWTEQDLEEIDRELNLRGRAEREQWVDQAIKLATPILPE